jgi:metallo-beta-lactamase family protein
VIEIINPLKRLNRSFFKLYFETFRRGGNVLIPTFALERAQELLYVPREFCDHGLLYPTTSFLITSLAIKITKIFLDNPEYFDEEGLKVFSPKTLI